MKAIGSIPLPHFSCEPIPRLFEKAIAARGFRIFASAARNGFVAGADCFVLDFVNGPSVDTAGANAKGPARFQREARCNLDGRR
jgi:hypothetical protein